MRSTLGHAMALAFLMWKGIASPLGEKRYNSKKMILAITDIN